jgi:hypothetical protein
MKDNHLDIEQGILRIAEFVQQTQRQSVLDIPIGTRKEAEYLRDLARYIINDNSRTIAPPITNVLPWIWSKETSGGPALTENGKLSGFELRFSPKRKEKSIKLLQQKAQAPNFRVPVSEEPFDVLYARWEEQALRKAIFKAKKVVGKDLIPETVGGKVARLWGRGICYPDAVELATFRLADSKLRGPYNFFTYYRKEKIISLNREYLVQIAAFHDLINNYGYLPQWMTFEHNESSPLAHVSIDIGVKLPEGRKIFVEVKKRKDHIETLISKVKSLGAKGVDLSAKDRSIDHLRKAKYILAGKPTFFVGYCPEGFYVYSVNFHTENRFTLEPNHLPQAKSFAGNSQ